MATCPPVLRIVVGADFVTFSGRPSGNLSLQACRAVLLATVGLLALGLILVPAQEWRLTLEFVAQTAGNGLFILASLAVGALIVSRRPDNIIGWIYALVALGLAASEVPGGYASRSLPGSSWAALLPNPPSRR
jgi:hypothetical protein